MVKRTTTTPVSVDEVVQGNGGPGENRSGGLERSGTGLSNSRDS
jgi:hypothetical protein